MSDMKQLTLDEEFRLFTGVVMNNWFALKVLINHSSESVRNINEKIKNLFDLLVCSTVAVINNKSHWVGPTEAIEDFFDVYFNTYVEDNSCEEVLSELVNYYNLLVENKREVLMSTIAHLADKRNIFTLEVYNPEKIVRRLEQSIPQQTSRLPEETAQCSNYDTENNINSIKTTDLPPDSTEMNVLQNSKMSQDSESNMAVEQSTSEWETVQLRRRRKN